jgi:hypothetical protein
LKEASERVCVVEEGISQYIKIITNQTLKVKNDDYVNDDYDDYVPKNKTKLHIYNIAKDPKEVLIHQDVKISKDTSKSAVNKRTEYVQNDTAWKHMTVKQKIQTIAKSDTNIPNIELSDKDKEILRKFER